MKLQKLTSEEAAKMLHVSRVFVEALIEEGRLPGAHATGDGQFRIPRVSVIAYKKEMRKTRKLGLQDMIDASEKAGLYDLELEDVRVRRRKP
jgi:excisionase family DNA binding protein